MAIVRRRYQDVGPPDFEISKVVGGSPVVAVTYGRATIDIDIDNTDPNNIVDLDFFMSTVNLAFTATASPKQVFRYVAVGGEGASFTINAAKGFVARATALYTVQFTLSRPGGNALKLVSIVEGSQTTTQFDVELSVAVEAGDVLQFTVEDR